jgi:hypothetical protein
LSDSLWLKLSHLYNYYYANMNASVAQLVELLICNQWVGGSSPSAGSICYRGGVPEWSKGTDCKSVGEAFGGSNPPPTTNLNELYVGDFGVDIGIDS